MANDYSAIRTTIAALIPDNQNCEISAKDVRDTLEAMLAATEDVDSRIGTGGSTGGTVDLTPYLTKAEAATTYQPIGAYLTTAAADAKYALATAIPSLTGYLKADGSVQIAGTFTPTNDRDLVYKAWVEQKISSASIGGGTAPDLSTYLLKSEAASTYATKAEIPSLTGYLTTAAADAKYALATAIPDLTEYYTKTEADAKYALTSAIPSITGLATTAALTSGLAGKQDASATLTSLATGFATATNGQVFGKKSDGAAGFFDLPTAPDLTEYYTKTEADAKYATTVALTSGLAGKQPVNGVLSTFAQQMTAATGGAAPVISTSVATLTTLATGLATAANEQVFGKKADGTAGFLDLPAAPDLSGYLKIDGSTPMGTGYVATRDLDVATKADVGSEMRRILRHGAAGGYLANIIAEGALITADTSLEIRHHAGLYLTCQGDITLTLSDSEQWQQWEEIGVFSETGTVTVHPAGATKINGATTDITIKALDFRVLKMHRTNEWFCVKTS